MKLKILKHSFQILTNIGTQSKEHEFHLSIMVIFALILKEHVSFVTTATVLLGYIELLLRNPRILSVLDELEQRLRSRKLKKSCDKLWKPKRRS